MKYRVTAGRFDIPTHQIDQFEATSDKEALKKFKEMKNDPCNAWDNLTLLRIDQEEKTTFLDETLDPE